MRCPSRKVTVGVAGTILAASISVVRAAGPPAPQPPALYGWGLNSLGQVGNSTAPATVTAPVKAVLPAGRAVVGLDGGGTHSLAALDDGTVLAWGGNAVGQLGIGAADAAAHRTPVAVPGLTGVTKVAAGDRHSLALKIENGVSSIWAWGAGEVGQLGDGTATAGHTAMSPVEVMGLTNVRSISAGYNHSLALLDDGTVWAWGDGASGQLGDGLSGAGHTAPLPQQVVHSDLSPLTDVVAIAAGQRHSLALKADGTVWAWGDNAQGQLGFLPVQAAPYPYPGQVGVGSALTGVDAVAAGGLHSLALRSDGTVWAWGRGTAGQLGDGSVAPLSTALPRQVTGLANVVAVAGGEEHSLAVRTDGTVWAWGRNALGELGTGDLVQRNGPAVLQNVTFASVLAAGKDHSLAATYEPVVKAEVVAPTALSCGVQGTATVNLEGYDLASAGVSETILVLDESGSIAPANFQQVRQFAINFVNSQNIGPTTVRVGIVMFSTDARTIIGLTANKTTVVNAINSIGQRGGSTCIGCGIAQADALMVSQGRAGVPRTIIVMTDGANNVNVSQLPSILATAKTRNTLVAIGVGSAVDANEIRTIASAPKLAILTPDFNTLLNVVDDLQGVLLNPGVSSVHLAVELASGFAPLSASNGGVVAGQTVQWTLPVLGSTKVPLTLQFRHTGRGGTLPLFASVTYSDDQGHSVTVPNADIQVSGCADRISLSPATATNYVDEPHTVTATVTDEFSSPVAGARVTFSVSSGPNLGTASASPVPTSTQGQASFTYANTGGPGVDVIEASLPDVPGVAAAPVQKVWRLRNQAPTAHAAAPASVALSGSHFATVTLDGTASADPDGQPQPLSYEWVEIGVGPVGNTAMATVGGLALGVHTFRLTVSDGDLADDDVVVVTVFDPTPPVILPHTAGTLGNEGWYVSDVSVSFSVADLESDVAAVVGCGAVDVLLDTPGVDFTCSATSAGGTSTSTVSLKRDATAPAVTPPPNQVVEATNPAGEVVTWAPPEVVEAGSGLASSSCVPASGSVFLEGTTTVTCSATDRAGNAGAATFTVQVKPGPDGRMYGAGHVEGGVSHHHFVFRVSQSRNHDYGRLEYWVNERRDCDKHDDEYDQDHDGHQDRDYGRDHRDRDRFVATAITAAVFSDDPGFRPGPGHRPPKIDSVRFVGTGKWNGRSGYTFAAFATDQGEPGRRRDTFSLVVMDAAGNIVGNVAGKLDKGNIQSTRLER